MELWALLGVLWCVMAGFGWWTAGQKDREPSEGLILGLLFGPFGVLIEALLPGGKPAIVRSDTDDEPDDSAALEFLGEMEPPREPPPPMPEWLRGVGEDRPPVGPPHV